MSLADRALLTNLTISQWGAKTHDNKATGTVETKYRTKGRVGHYNKQLLPGAEELQEVSRIATSIRSFFYKQTLPWLTDGTRILSSKNYMDFSAEFRKKEGEFQRAVKKLIKAYPKLRADAQKKLGKLFNATEYPSVNELQDKFACEISYTPMPDVEDFRIAISESEKKTFVKNMRKIEAEAARECWHRLHDVVSKAAIKLQHPKAILRESLMENIQEICSLLPKLNVTDDPKLDKMLEEVQGIVSGISTEDCRTHKDARDEAAKQLDHVTSKMAAFMGGA